MVVAGCDGTGSHQVLAATCMMGSHVFVIEALVQLAAGIWVEDRGKHGQIIFAVAVVLLQLGGLSSERFRWFVE